MVPETWNFLSRGIEDGREICYIARVKHDVIDRRTVWKLMRYTDGWRSVAQTISTGVYREFPEARGVKLTDSRIDQILKAYAEDKD